MTHTSKRPQRTPPSPRRAAHRHVNNDLFHFHRPAPVDVIGLLPTLHGRPIDVSFRPSLTAYRGQLLSGSQQGAAVHAGTSLRERYITLEEQMLQRPRLLSRIFVHEVFHFVWTRLGNPLRSSYEQMVQKEFNRRARGELGWSAESMKLELTEADRLLRTKRWRDYLCESFCDTAGWIFGAQSEYAERTLARTFRQARRRWFEQYIGGGPLAV